LRVSEEDAAVLRAVGTYLGVLAGRDLAARCAEGRRTAKEQAMSRRERKRVLTAQSSSRWAGAITRTSEDQWQLADRNLKAELSSLKARVARIEARLAVPAGAARGRLRGYATPAERHGKVLRRNALQGRLARAERQAGAGAVSVVRGGRRLLRARGNLEAAGMTVTQWRGQWEAARLFLTADGEAGKKLGNETIRWDPGEQWLEVKLPPSLAHLANAPRGRYRLSCLVEFPYRGNEVAAQATTGAVRYDIALCAGSGRWYLDASWKAPARPVPGLDDLRQSPVVAVDVNVGHLAVAVIAADGNIVGIPRTIPLDLAGLPAATRDGRLRAAITTLIATAKANGARSVVIEDLDFTQARTEGRERTGSRPSRGKRGRRFRGAIAGIPTGRFRDRLTQMTFNAGLHVIVIDPAYTSRWGKEHWLPLLQRHHQNASGHHAAAVVAGRRGLGHRARNRANGNPAAPADAARPAPARPPAPQPAPRPATRKRAIPPGPRQPHPRAARPESLRRTTARDQAAHHRPGPPTKQETPLPSD
jgi:hypothetical protein